MKIGYCLNGFRRWPIELTIPVLSKLGYDGVEIMGAKPMLDPGDYTPELQSELRDMLKNYKIEPVNIACGHNQFTNLMTFDAVRCRYPEESEPLWSSVSNLVRKVKLEYTKAVIDLAAGIGAQSITTTGRETGTRPDLAHKMVIDGWKAAAKYAADKKIYITILTTLAGLEMYSPDEILEAIQEVNSPWLRCTFDTLHTYVNRIPMEDSVKKLGKLIENVHFSDGLRYKHFHMVPGEGEINLHKFLETLMSIGFDGYLLINVYTDPFQPGETAKRAIESTRKLLKEVGAL